MASISELKAKIAEAKKEISKQLNDIQNGAVSDYEFESAKKCNFV